MQTLGLTNSNRIEGICGKDELATQSEIPYFGTTFEQSRNQTIGAIQQKIQAVYPDYEVRRAFTSQRVINKLKPRDHLIRL